MSPYNMHSDALLTNLLAQVPQYPDNLNRSIKLGVHNVCLSHSSTISFSKVEIMNPLLYLLDKVILEITYKTHTQFGNLRHQLLC